jgi:threonine dehydrogenase-like Zn-dependent dehydrogenase
MNSLLAAPPAPLTLINRPEDVLAPEAIRIAVGAAGICHTDFYLLAGTHPGATYPRVPGHEFSGVIIALGSNVPAGPQPGMRVGVMSTLACGECEACRDGRPARCTRALYLGTTRDGGWQEQVDVPWRAAVPLAEHVSFAEASLFEPTANGHAAVTAGRVTSDDHVVAIGPGAIGILTALVAAQLRPRSLAVLGLSADAERLKLARKLTGADVGTSDGDGHSAAAALAHATVVMQCAPSIAATAFALEHLQDGARLVIEGYAGDKGALPIGSDDLVVRSLQLIGVNGWVAEDYRAVASLAAARKIDLSGVPVAEFALSDHDAAVRAAHDNRSVLRVLFRPDASD